MSRDLSWGIRDAMLATSGAAVMSLIFAGVTFPSSDLCDVRFGAS